MFITQRDPLPPPQQPQEQEDDMPSLVIPTRVLSKHNPRIVYSTEHVNRLKRKLMSNNHRIADLARELKLVTQDKVKLQTELAMSKHATAKLQEQSEITAHKISCYKSQINGYQGRLSILTDKTINLDADKDALKVALRNSLLQKWDQSDVDPQEFKGVIRTS